MRTRYEAELRRQMCSFSTDYNRVSIRLAGNAVPTHSPKPMRAAPGLPHQPRITTASPSSRKVRFSPFGSVNAFLPFRLSSSIEPACSGLGPDCVPLPNMSPGCRLQPLTVWCATICDTVQYESLKLPRDSRVGT